MRAVDLIAKKRDGSVLSAAEIEFLVTSYTNGEVPDYQMSAWLMSVFLQGMTDEEIAALTLSMAHSGEIVDLSSAPGIKVDKHSTGGVGDTTTLILAPLVAAAGIPVAKMSGRGLGFTGGTIDKLEAIPGFKTVLAEDEFLHNLMLYNIAVTGQTAQIAPADGKMYALRDVTATVESIPLIASSIMSKKIAAGADKILLDVKVGKGAFMKDMDKAVSLAETMVRIGELANRETIAILTSMEQPLGQAVGNSLEVMEAIDVLSGRYAGDLRHVCLVLGSYMLALAGKTDTIELGYQYLAKLLDTGEALKKFREFVAAQGGNAKIIDDASLLPTAEFEQEISSNREGYITEINAAQIGLAAVVLGAGREYKGQAIDLAAGLYLKVRIGDKVTEGQSLATLYSNDYSKLAVAAEMIQSSIKMASDRVLPPDLLLGVIDKQGFHPIDKK